MYYTKLSKMKKRVFYELSTKPEKLTSLRRLFSNAEIQGMQSPYVHPISLRIIEDKALSDLLDYPDFYVQYSVLRRLLARFEQLDENVQSAIYKVVNNPPGIWVGGAMGILTRRNFENRSLDEKAWPSLLLKSWDKNIAGALMGEMVRYNFDKQKVGLQTTYERELLRLAKDKELESYALGWIDQLESLNIYSCEYLLGVRRTLNKLSKA